MHPHVFLQMRSVCRSICVALLVAFSGCSTTTGPSNSLAGMMCGILSGAPSSTASIKHKGPRWNSSSSKSALRIVDVSAEQSSDGSLLVRIALRNPTKSEIRVEAQCIFKDRSGRETKKTAWERILCAAGVTTLYEVRSPSPHLSILINIRGGESDTELSIWEDEWEAAKTR